MLIFLILIIAGFISTITFLILITIQTPNLNIYEALFVWGGFSFTIGSFILGFGSTKLNEAKEKVIRKENKTIKTFGGIIALISFALFIVGAIGVQGFNDFNFLVQGYLISLGSTLILITLLKWIF